MSGDRPWQKPTGREARNEQAKLRASVLNAAAIALFVTGFFGPWINPVVAAELTISEQALVLFAAWGFHLLARFAVRGIEDK